MEGRGIFAGMIVQTTGHNDKRDINDRVSGIEFRFWYARTSSSTAWATLLIMEPVPFTVILGVGNSPQRLPPHRFREFNCMEYKQGALFVQDTHLSGQYSGIFSLNPLKVYSVSGSIVWIEGAVSVTRWADFYLIVTKKHGFAAVAVS